MAVPHLAPYCASKFALVGLSESFRAELLQYGVREHGVITLEEAVRQLTTRPARPRNAA